MQHTKKLYEEDENDVNLFIFFKKLPPNEQFDAEIFLTPEKIFGLTYPNQNAISDFHFTLRYLKEMSNNELVDNVSERHLWEHFIIFKKIVKALKEYLRLRPNVLEEYPEFFV